MPYRKGKLTPELRRARRARVRLRGSALRPRLSVFRSVRHLSAQVIDDAAGMTIASVSDNELSAGAKKGAKKGAKLPNRRDRALWVGAEIAERAKAKGVKAVNFDRGRYRYHGLVAAVAEGARKGGLKF